MNTATITCDGSVVGITGAPTGLSREEMRRAPSRSTGPLPGREDGRGIMVPGVGREIRVKIASGHDELDQAFRLLATNYRARGFESPSPKPFRFTPYHALPGTTTFVAKHET